jgi:hypothetical protein
MPAYTRSERGRKENSAMENFIEFAGIASAIVASMGLAMGLEWLTLNGLLRLMPRRAPKPLEDEES